MKYWSVILILGLVASCGRKDPLSPKLEPTADEIIQGSWVTHIIDTSSGTSRAFPLNFEDSFVYLYSSYNNAMKFKISDSTLTLIPTKSTRPMSTQDIKIVEVNSSKLMLLLPPTKWEGIRGLLGSHCKDTLEFSRITKKNDLNPTKIGFSSSMCFGECPSMKFEIDEDRKIRFFGGIFTDLEGGYTGKVTQPVYDRILAQIRTIPLDSLKSEYEAPWTDDQTCYLQLKMRDTTIYVRSYGNYLQPYELTIVYENLMDLYNHIKLKQDSTVTRFSIQKSLEMDHPIPPPLVQN